MSNVYHSVLCIVQRVMVASRSIEGVARLAMKIVSVLSVSHGTSDGDLAFVQARYTVSHGIVLSCMAWYGIVLSRVVLSSLVWYCPFLVWYRSFGPRSFDLSHL